MNDAYRNLKLLSNALHPLPYRSLFGLFVHVVVSILVVFMDRCCQISISTNESVSSICGKVFIINVVSLNLFLRFVHSMFLWISVCVQHVSPHKFSNVTSN